jgi:hypothetical protein
MGPCNRPAGHNVRENWYLCNYVLEKNANEGYLYWSPTGIPGSVFPSNNEVKDGQCRQVEKEENEETQVQEAKKTDEAPEEKVVTS